MTVDGKVTRARYLLRGGESVKVYPQEMPEQFAFQAEDIPLDVVHEDASLIVINKPAELASQGGTNQIISIDSSIKFLDRIPPTPTQSLHSTLHASRPDSSLHACTSHDRHAHAPPSPPQWERQ